jgi:predicted secreted hydrolase
MKTRKSPGISAFAALVAAMILAGCSGGPILANPPAVHPLPAPTSSPRPVLPDPQPLAFPRDDGPHQRLTEWWYYTGHLVNDAGRRFGFEFVVFRAERGSFPISWASHLALTDESAQRFLYGQRSQVGPQVDRSPRSGDDPAGFALQVTGADPSRPGSGQAEPWSMVGQGGSAHLTAGFSAEEAGAQGQPAAFSLDLELQTELPPVLHDRIGFIDFGPAGGSYYYSRPRMTAAGSLRLDSGTFHVTGEAWFDHQWGDFISIGGGWDWFAVNLADRSGLTLSVVRDAAGQNALVYGTLVRPDGSYLHLDATAFTIDSRGSWLSPTTGIRYPAGWQITVPAASLAITLEPALADQELDTRPTTGVVYWEGSQRVSATKGGRPLPGEAYVELTGYGTASGPRAGPASALPLASP